ncbi:enoyl-CoA hydratase/isomerase family protein (plasmid) [Arthrobacter sp. Z1-9]
MSNPSDTTPPALVDGCLLLQGDDGVVVLAIENARRRNCLSLGVERELIAHLESLAKGRECRAIVLTGSDGYFSAGGDVARMAAADKEQMVAILRQLQRIVALIHAIPVPVVAAVEGGAAGGGVSLAAVCDFVVSASDARFTMGFDRIGLAPDMGALFSFERRIGLSATRRLAYLGGVLGASEAHRLGLVDELCEPGSARSTAVALARTLALRSRIANGVVKRTVAESSSTLRKVFEQELESAEALYASEQFLSAVKPGSTEQ